MVIQRHITYAITKYGHASKGITVGKVGETENKVSHINPGYLQDKFALRNFLYSDVYQIKLENLINQQQQELLKTHFGEDWLKHIETKFHQIDRDMHDTQKTNHFHVSAEGGSYRFAQIGTSLLQGGHQNKLIRDHIDSDVLDRVMSKGEWDEYNTTNVTKMLCSEFIGMTIIATFQELNDQLRQELQENGVEDTPNVLVQNPISEYEKMHLMTPVRLLTALQEKEAVVKVNAPDRVSMLVSTDTSKTTSFRDQLSDLRTGSLGQSKENASVSLPRYKFWSIPDSPSCVPPLNFNPTTGLKIYAPSTTNAFSHALLLAKHPTIRLPRGLENSVFDPPWPPTFSK